MKRFSFFIILLLLPIFLIHAQEHFTIKYISTDAIYFDGGLNHGLQVGDTLEVRRSNQSIARIRIQFIADNTASCTPPNRLVVLKVGDQAIVRRFKPSGGKVEKTVTPVATPKELSSKKPKIFHSKQKTFNGSIAMQVYHWDDKSKSNYDFTQPTLRVNFAGKRLAGKYWDLQIRTRARYDKRTRRYSTQVPQKEMLNRIYQCYLDYNNPDALINAKIGRIITNPLSGIGYLDGLLMHINVSKSFNMGILAGLAPEWQYADIQTKIRKYGAFATYRVMQDRLTTLETTLAVAGEYHQKTVSREFIYLQTQYNWNQKLWLYQSLELDMNRDWRKERTGQSVTLSNLYLNGLYDLFTWMSVGLNFDSRKNFWTWEYRTLADSLFDNLARQGARAQLNLRLAGGHYFTATAGLANREKDSHPLYSYTASYNNNNFFQTRLIINSYAAGFTSPFYKGLSANVSLGKAFGQSLYFYCRYGQSFYQVTQRNSRINHQYQVNGNINLGRTLYMNLFFEYDQGDDEKGQRTWVEFGYRL